MKDSALPSMMLTRLSNSTINLSKHITGVVAQTFSWENSRTQERISWRSPRFDQMMQMPSANIKNVIRYSVCNVTDIFGCVEDRIVLLRLICFFKCTFQFSDSIAIIYIDYKHLLNRLSRSDNILYVFTHVTCS